MKTALHYCQQSGKHLTREAMEAKRCHCEKPCDSYNLYQRMERTRFAAENGGAKH